MTNSKLKNRHYRINPETLQLERIEHGFRYWLRRSGGYVIGGICLGVIFFYTFLYFFPSPREASLMQYNRNLSAQIEVMDQQLDQMQIVLTDLAQRDDNLYRAILGAEPIPLSARMGATHQISYYDSIAHMTNTQLAADIQRKVDILEKELYVQARSYDEVLRRKNRKPVWRIFRLFSPCLTKNSSVWLPATAGVSTPSITSAVSTKAWTSRRL